MTMITSVFKELTNPVLIKFSSGSDLNQLSLKKYRTLKHNLSDIILVPPVYRLLNKLGVTNKSVRKLDRTKFLSSISDLSSTDNGMLLITNVPKKSWRYKFNNDTKILTEIPGFRIVYLRSSHYKYVIIYDNNIPIASGCYKRCGRSRFIYITRIRNEEIF